MTLRKTLSLSLICLIINSVAMNTAFAGAKQEEQAQFTHKVKIHVSRLGTGESAQIEVKLDDKTELKGYVKEASSESFLLADAKSGAVTIVQYPQVKKLKGYNLSTGQKVAVGVGVSAGLIFLIWALYSTSD